MDIEDYLKREREEIDLALDRYLPSENDYPSTIHKSMRYSVFAGGKRVRPVLALATAEAVKGNKKKVLPVACVFELIHTYSLIHDDLPAMDDDDLRRGRPSNHKVFGDAVAILAGDALLTLAFDLLATKVQCVGEGEEKILLQIVHEISKAAGSMGMVGGQVVDIESQGKAVDFPVLEYIHIHKTGSLILASIRAGALISMAGEKELIALTKYGEALGLAFQIADDVLDVEGASEKMGKNKGSDKAKDKATYPALLGLDESKKRAEELVFIALSAIDFFGDEATPLKKIAKYIINRQS